MSEGPEWVGCGLVLDSVGLGPRASPSAAVVQNGPQAEDAGGAHEKPRVAALPKEAWGFQSANSLKFFPTVPAKTSESGENNTWRHRKLCARGTR